MKNGTTIETPPIDFEATAEPSATATQVIVKTYDAATSPLDSPFSLLIAC